MTLNDDDPASRDGRASSGQRLLTRPRSTRAPFSRALQRIQSPHRPPGNGLQGPVAIGRRYGNG